MISSLVIGVVVGGLGCLKRLREMLKPAELKPAYVPLKLQKLEPEIFYEMYYCDDCREEVQRLASIFLIVVGNLVVAEKATGS